ncbi:MAG: STAS domain-containing protein [Methylocystis sp.]|uniref:STAS domain-containing protein n=1 Tax=Methylocystis sp. TaxID=1911079 RepID=UPI003DA1F0AC
MTLEISKQLAKDRVSLSLTGRLDANTCALLEKELATADADCVTLDLGECQYVSSAGLRVLLLAHQKQAARGGSLNILNVTPNVRSVLDVTGLGEIFRWKPKPREISLESAERISAGAFGDCYRLDPETVVKLYREGVDPVVAEREKQFARAALILGVPTAISYDVVACGNRTGIVYEMLEAELFSSIIRKTPDDMATHARQLADIAKTIHRATGDPAMLPDMKTQLRAYIEEMGFFLSSDDIQLLQRQLEKIPSAETCVHFDIHSSNIMFKGDQPFIIDMGDFSIGSYFFDIGLIATIYDTPEFNVCELATGLTPEMGRELFEKFLQAYFSDKPAEDYRFFQDNRHFLASLRAIYTITALPKMRDQLAFALKEFILPKIRQET